MADEGPADPPPEGAQADGPEEGRLDVFANFGYRLKIPANDVLEVKTARRIDLASRGR